MGNPSLDEFRLWLQAEIADVEELEPSSDRNKRLVQLEMALQESMAFSIAWDIRTEASVNQVIRQKPVRLISEAPIAEQNQQMSTETCVSCECIIEEDLDFCPSCGENR
tara:strand:+ start:25 stop:351 length:327 start_codon:yes stop_codon:yes gene_type:complete